MRELKHLPVNWIDGMKISKDHFIAADNANRTAISDVASNFLSPVKYGVLPAYAGEETFNVRISVDNQNAVRVSIMACHALTCGGVRIALPNATNTGISDKDGAVSTTLQITGGTSSGETNWWVALTANPYDVVPVGEPDSSEFPPRHPFAAPSYQVRLVPESQYLQFAQNPYSLYIGKITGSAGRYRSEDEYIPACMSINAHPDILSLHSELDQFFSSLEVKALQIVQKIFKKDQKNNISELIQFFCDRILLFIGQAITEYRWRGAYESPIVMFSIIAGLARVMKNAVDQRVGSGKDELLRYMSEWCDLKQGQFESLLASVTNSAYDHNDINKNVEKLVEFVQAITKLFDSLVKLDFIGQVAQTGIFVKEEPRITHSEQSADKAKRRFFSS